MAVQMKPMLLITAIEVLPKFVQNLEEAGKFVKKIKESDPDVVSSSVNRSGSDDDRRMLQAGLLYLCLTEPDSRLSSFQDIVLTSRDNLNYALSELTRLVAEAWPKMHQSVRKNVLNLISELIATRGANVELLILHLYRRLQSGDLSHQNLWLIQSVLDLMIRNKEWLENVDRRQFLMPLTIYTFLRLIPDHQNYSSNPSSLVPDVAQTPILAPNIVLLRQRESNFVVEIIRKNFDRCAVIGRDLIRMIYMLSRAEPFQRLWTDILTDISSVSTTFKSITSVMDIVTPQYYVQTLIPQEMETWIRWMFRNVHCVSGFPVRRYQDFFNKKYFLVQESKNLRVCLVRYIVTFFYPDNDMLASTLIPRWNVVSWLISQCNCPIASQHLKMALFFDWFFFKPNDCIMNVEPAMLAITNNISTRSQPFALSLVEYLTKTTLNFYPPLAERIAVSVRAGLEDMLRLGVIRSINPLLDGLLRASPDIYRSFSTLIGPLVDSTLPLPAALPTPPSSLSSTASEGAGGGCVDDAVAHGVGLNHALNSPSNASPPTDPRLRRNSLSNTVAPPKNGAPHLPPSALPFKHHYRPPSPDQPDRISPSALPHVDLSTTLFSSDDIKSLMATAPAVPKRPKSSDTKLLPPLIPSFNSEVSPSIKEPLPALASNFESLSSPEYRIGPNVCGDSVQQRIDNLRRRFQSYQLRYRYKIKTNVDVDEIVTHFEGQIREHLENLISTAKLAGIFKQPCITDKETPSSTPNSSSTDDTALGDVCEAMQTLIESFLYEDFSYDPAMAGRIADVICQLCLPLFDPVDVSDCTNGSVVSLHPFTARLPSRVPITQEQIDASLTLPLFVPLRYLCEMSRCNAKREILLFLLTELQGRQPRFGYYLLYFLAVSTVNDEKMTTYRDICANQENSSLLTCLLQDMELLADDNRFLFCYLLPTIYGVFSNELANNTDFIRLVVSKIDPSQANYLVCEILRGHLNLFHRHNITDMLRASLEWTSMEQFFFWQLVNAHELPTKHFLPLISLVDGQKHPEACSHLLLLLQLEKPTNEVVRLLLSRCVAALSTTSTSSVSDDLLSVTALHYWGCPGRQNAHRFVEILGNMVTTAVCGLRSAQDADEGGNSLKKRNSLKNNDSSEHLSQLISILSHLDCMRKKCKNIAMLETPELQSALQQVIRSPGVPVHVKDHFAELLSLVEDDSAESAPTSRGSGTTRSSRQETSETAGSGVGSSKGGHSLRNLDSRRAAEAERRLTTTSSGGNRKKSRRKSDEDGEGSSDESNSDNDAESEGALAIDDSIDVAPEDDTTAPVDEEVISLTSTSSDRDSSDSEIDDDTEDPVSNGKKRPMRGRSATNKRQHQTPPKKKNSLKTRKLAVALNSDDEDESEAEDVLRFSGASKRRKMVSRRLLDD